MAEIPSVVDVGLVIDRSDWGTRQRWISLLAATAIFIDGFDNQALSFAIPVLLHEWHLGGGSFSPIFAIGLIGSSIGTIGGGYLSDRYGRKPLMVGGVLLLGSLSIAMAGAQDLTTLTVMRGIASLGLGAVMPTALAMVAELSPPRVRTLALTLAIVCLPLGGMAAGLVASQVLIVASWRWLFLTGGLAGIAAATALLLALPESPRFLVRRPRRWPELARTLTQFGHRIASGSAFTDSTERPRVHTSIRALFGPDLRRTTLAFCAAFAMVLLALQLLISWLPTLLTNQRLDVPTASLGLSVYNLGGVFGAVLFGFLTVTARPRTIAFVTMLGASVVASILGTLHIEPVTAQVSLVIAVLGLHGFFAHASQVSMTALSTQVFPTSVRATGSGATIAFGRIVAALATASAGPVLISSGARGYFWAVAAALLLAVIATLALPARFPTEV